MLNQGERKKLLIEYARLVLKQIQIKNLSASEETSMNVIREKLGLDHLAILREVKALTSETVSQ